MELHLCCVQLADGRLYDKVDEKINALCNQSKVLLGNPYKEILVVRKCIVSVKWQIQLSIVLSQ